MTTSLEEPKFDVASLQILRRFQDNLRARIYNLVEDQARLTHHGRITPEIIERCILQAIRELAETEQACVGK